VCAPVLWQNAVVLQQLTERKEWKFFGVLPKADPGRAVAWWTVLLLRGILPAAFAMEVGTHDELMAKSGPYSELYSIQAAAYR
jgi:hypothetical protein